MIESVVAILLIVAAFWFVTRILGFGMWILWTLLVGLLVGALAKAVLPKRANLSATRTALFGVAGSFLGNFFGKGLLDLGGLLTFAMSVAMAAALIWFLHLKGR